MIKVPNWGRILRGAGVRSSSPAASSASNQASFPRFDELAFHNRLGRPGTIIEVGANKGDLTLHFSVWERNKVIALEPVPHIFRILEQRLASGFGGPIPKRVVLMEAAAGAVSGSAKIRVPRTDAGEIDEWASLAKSFESMKGVDFAEYTVPVVTLDQLNCDDVSNIKIDAEGFEIEVLEGARKTLSRCRPAVSIECEERHREGSTWYVPGFMKALGYDCYWYLEKEHRFFDLSKFDRRTMQVAGSSPRDRSYSDPYIFVFYFIPEEDTELRERLTYFGELPPPRSEG